jgi:hypothetical protein
MCPRRIALHSNKTLESAAIVASQHGVKGVDAAVQKTIARIRIDTLHRDEKSARIFVVLMC